MIRRQPRSTLTDTLLPYTTLFRCIVGRTVQRYPQAEALVFGGRRWSYHQWNERINRPAHTFSDMGVRPFDRVALYLFTGEASATAYFACQKIGAVAVPMNFRLAAGELAHILRDSGARLLIYSHDLAAQVMQARERGVRCSDHWVPDGTDGNPVPQSADLQRPGL